MVDNNTNGGKLFNQRLIISMAGIDLLIIGIGGCIFLSELWVLFQTFITFGITLISVATISFLFESKGWVKHLRNTLSDLMTDPEFLLESFSSEGIRDKCKKIIKGGLKIDILGDEFFDTIDKNYINPLLGPINENYHMILNFKVGNIAGTKVVNISSRRCFRAYNPTENNISLFPDKKMVHTRYYINEKHIKFIKGVNDKKIIPYKLESFKLDDCECVQDYLEYFKPEFNKVKNILTSILECNEELLPYKKIKTMKKVDYYESFCYPLESDYHIWIFKTIIKDMTILLHYPEDKLNISAYITKHSPDAMGKFAKKLAGKLGEETIISHEVYFPGTVLIVYWAPK